MAATTRDSTLYDKLHVKKRVYAANERFGRVVPIPFQHTVVSGETGGASAGVQDKVNLCVIPKDHMVIDMIVSAEAIWASAGTNGTLQIGDSGDDDRYMQATELYTAAGGPIGTEAGAKPSRLLSFAGQNYVPTADTVVVATWKTANPVVGKVFKGCFLCVPLA
jgi:hypothetical protein